jgi:hypothetical protein
LGAGRLSLENGPEFDILEAITDLEARTYFE